MDASVKKERVFRFKRFSVSHCSAAMKVGTDGVLLGAWADTEGCSHVWDVGAGSGLIALMVAQRCEASVCAIEVDSNAASEAMANVAASPWCDRITVMADDITACAPKLNPPDLIVSNPPFFVDSLQAPDHHRNIARHENTLSVATLLRIAARDLKADGRLCMITPADRADDIEWECALSRLFIRRRVDIRTVLYKAPTRTLWEISRRSGTPDFSEQSLRDASGRWSDWYVTLTKEYYLYLK